MLRQSPRRIPQFTPGTQGMPGPSREHTPALAFKVTTACVTDGSGPYCKPWV
jgi:hypothetical protein